MPGPELLTCSSRPKGPPVVYEYITKTKERRVALRTTGDGWLGFVVIAGREGSSVPSQGPPLPLFSQVFILKGVKVLYFETLLQVFILKVVTLQWNWAGF